MTQMLDHLLITEHLELRLLEHSLLNKLWGNEAVLAKKQEKDRRCGRAL